MMNYLNIYISGTPNAGKSTLCNSLVGTNLSTINTQRDHIFTIEPSYNGEPEVIIDTDDFVCYKTKLYDNCLLQLNCTVNVHDYVGIEKVSKFDGTIKKIRNDSKMCDILIYLIDTPAFYKSINDGNIDQINILKRLTEKIDHRSLIVCVLNKLDSIVVNPQHTVLFNSEDQIMYNVCEGALHDFFASNGNTNYKIIPACLNKAMFYSAGENKFFNDKLSEASYSAEIAETNGNLRHLLRKYGLTNVTNEIVSFVNSHENEIINKRVFEELDSLQDKSIENLIPILSKIRENEKGFIPNIVRYMRDSLNDIIGFLKCSDDLDKSTEEKKQLFEKLEVVFKEKTHEDLDPKEMFFETVNNIQCQNYINELSEKWDFTVLCKLYEKKGLSEGLLDMFMTKHFDEHKYVEYIKHISDMTNHNMNYMYTLFHSFLNKFPQYTLAFKQTPIKNPYFDLIRIQLMKDRNDVYQYEMVKIGLDHVKYSEIKTMFFRMVSIMNYIDEKLNSTVSINDSTYNVDSISSASN